MRVKNYVGDLEIPDPVSGDVTTYSCTRWQVWPPREFFLFGCMEICYQEGTPEQIERFRVWEAACGLEVMSSSKCPGCKFVAVNGVPVRKDGSQLRHPKAQKHPAGHTILMTSSKNKKGQRKPNLP